MIKKAEIEKFDYQELVNKDSVLHDRIEKAFGPNGIGVCLVSNIPNYEEYRKQLLPQANVLINLPQHELDKLVKSDMDYSVGWIQNKEQIRGRTDCLKGVFQAYVVDDEPIKDPIDELKQQGGKVIRNVWPENHIVNNFEKNFKQFGLLMREVGALLGYHIDKYIKFKIPQYINGTIESVIKNGNQQIGRLIHYYVSKEKKIYQDDWCGWHKDFSVITGLASSMYFKENGTLVENYDEDNDGGLYIKNRLSEQQKVVIPDNCLGFQTGEVSQILSGGIIEATPHCVVRGDKCIQDGVCRINYACFISPNQEFKIFVPDESMIEYVSNMESYFVSSLKDRWKNNMSYGVFSSNSLKSIR